MSGPVYSRSETIASLRAQLADAQRIQELQARLDALLRPSSESTRSVPIPTISAALRLKEQRIFQELLREKGSGPLLVWFRLFDAKVNGLKHEIPTLLEEDGSFGYKRKDESYVNGLHSFEVMWHIRCDYELSGQVHYERLLASNHTFHCLKYAFLDGETRYSLLSKAHDILKEMDATRHKTGGYATPPSSPGPTHPPPVRRKGHPKASNSAAASSSVTARTVAARTVVSRPLAASSVASSSVASSSVASSSVAASTVASNSVASNSVASNSVAANSVAASSPRPPPGILRRALSSEQELMPKFIWIGGTLIPESATKPA